ncbi:hypothetical protein Efla_001261 [Eimeria flavescens]
MTVGEVSFLQCLPFLEGCPDGDMKALAEQLVEKTYSGPEVILRQSQEANQVILVKRGSVLVLRTINRARRGGGPSGKKLRGGPPPGEALSNRAPADSHRASGSRQQHQQTPSCSRISQISVVSLRKGTDSQETTDSHKKLVLQVASLGKFATYGAREILEGEKASAVQKRGSVYSATLVAFPAAQVRLSELGINVQTLTEPLRLCFGAASSPLPSDDVLLRHYHQSVRWEKFERDRKTKTIREWELPPKPSRLAWQAAIGWVATPICHRQSLSWVLSSLQEQQSEEAGASSKGYKSEAINKLRQLQNCLCSFQGLEAFGVTFCVSCPFPTSRKKLYDAKTLKRLLPLHCSSKLAAVQLGP